MTDAYDLRSNIKGKPGSQGTLFQVKDKGLLNPQQRWPRGYTPERQEAVRSALSETAITHSMEEPVRDVHTTPGGQERYARYPKMENRVTSAIARSTIPTKHLGLLSKIHDEPDEGDHGTYWPDTREIGIHTHNRGSKEDVDRTLIHEIGHHAENVSMATAAGKTRELAFKRAGIGSGQTFDGASQDRAIKAIQDVTRLRPGVDEALADNYYMQHYRGPGRKGERPTSGLYQNTFTSDRLDQKYPGYNETTDNPPSHNLGPQFRQEKLF